MSDSRFWLSQSD